MASAPPINPELLERAERFAQANSVSVSAVIEQALSTYLAPSIAATVSVAQNGKLPVATRLKLPPETFDMSYGKLLERADEGLNMDNAR